MPTVQVVDQTADTAARVQRILSEGPIPCTKRARALGVDPATFFRWGHRPHVLPDGTSVTLEVIKLGGKLYTSEQALMRYLTAINGSAASVPESPTPAARTRQADHAHAELSQLLNAG